MKRPSLRSRPLSRIAPDENALPSRHTAKTVRSRLKQMLHIAELSKKKQPNENLIPTITLSRPLDSNGTSPRESFSDEEVQFDFPDQSESKRRIKRPRLFSLRGPRKSIDKGSISLPQTLISSRKPNINLKSGFSVSTIISPRPSLEGCIHPPRPSSPIFRQPDCHNPNARSLRRRPSATEISPKGFSRHFSFCDQKEGSAFHSDLTSGQENSFAGHSSTLSPSGILKSQPPLKPSVVEPLVTRQFLKPKPKHCLQTATPPKVKFTRDDNVCEFSPHPRVPISKTSAGYDRSNNPASAPPVLPQSVLPSLSTMSFGMFETSNSSPPEKHEVSPSSRDRVTLDPLHEINYTLADVTGREMHWSTSYFRNLDKASKRPAVRSVPWPPTSLIISRPSSPPLHPACDLHKPLPLPPLSWREVTAVDIEKVEQVSLLPTPSVESPGGNSPSPRLEQVSGVSGEEKGADATAARWAEGFQREQDWWEGSSPTKADFDEGPSKRASLTNTTCDESIENVRGDQRSISMSECSYEENPITIPADAVVNTRESIGRKDMEIDDERTRSWSRDSISEISAGYAVERSNFSPGDETIVSKSADLSKSPRELSGASLGSSSVEADEEDAEITDELAARWEGAFLKESNRWASAKSLSSPLSSLAPSPIASPVPSQTPQTSDSPVGVSVRTLVSTPSKRIQDPSALDPAAVKEVRAEMQARFGQEKIRWAFAQLGVDVDAEFLSFDETAAGDAEVGTEGYEAEYESEEVSNGLRERDDDGPADAWEGWMFEIDYHSVLWDEHPLHVIFEDEVW